MSGRGAGVPVEPGGNGADGPSRTWELDLPSATLRFCRALRERGVLTTPAESVDAVRVLETIDLADRQELYLALRAVLVGRMENYPLFDEVFREFWGGEGSAEATPRERARSPETRRRRAESARQQRSAMLSLQNWIRPEAADSETAGVPAFGEHEALTQKDFSAFGSDELEEVARVAARLARRLATRPSRRWRAVRRGSRVDPRRTVRRAFRTGGDVVELAFRARRPKKARLALLCDVSGSMDLYSRLLLQFLYALQSHFGRVETFAFSTRLSRITDELRGESYRSSLQRLGRSVHDWSGGTRIGASLAEFNRHWPRLVDRRTIVIVLSDGWDTGDPEELADALRVLRKRAGKLIWLNPLLGSPDYQPLTRGMQAALPHLDVFAPAHNLASLQALARHLTV